MDVPLVDVGWSKPQLKMSVSKKIDNYNCNPLQLKYNDFLDQYINLKNSTI